MDNKQKQFDAHFFGKKEDETLDIERALICTLWIPTVMFCSCWGSNSGPSSCHLGHSPCCMYAYLVDEQEHGRQNQLQFSMEEKFLERPFYLQLEMEVGWLVGIFSGNRFNEIKSSLCTYYHARSPPLSLCKINCCRNEGRKTCWMN